MTLSMQKKIIETVDSGTEEWVERALGLKSKVLACSTQCENEHTIPTSIRLIEGLLNRTAKCKSDTTKTNKIKMLYSHSFRLHSP